MKEGFLNVFFDGNAFLRLFGLLSILVVFTIVLIIVVRFKKFLFYYNKQQVKNSVYGILFEHLFSKSHKSDSRNKILERLKNAVPFQKTWCKEFIILQIIEIAENLKGKQKEKLLLLVYKLDLDSHIESLLDSFFWTKQSKGLYFCRETDYDEPLEKIKKLVNSKNHQLAFSALLCYITLEKSDPLEILSSFYQNKSILEIESILEIVKRKNIKLPKNFRGWFERADESLLILALKMIRQFNELNYASEILPLLDHRDEKVRREAIITIGSTFLFEAEELLIQKFYFEDAINQIVIIGTLKEIGGQSTIDFLYFLLTLKKPGEIKLAILYALKSLEPDYKVDPNEKELLLMDLHINDDYINA